MIHVEHGTGHHGLGWYAWAVDRECWGSVWFDHEPTDAELLREFGSADREVTSCAS